MNWQVFASDIVLLAILVPALMYAMLPLRDRLRMSAKRTMVTAAAVLCVVILGFAFIGANVSFHFKWIYIMSLIPVFALHYLLLDAKGIIKVFCFFNSTMIAGNGIVYGLILGAPLEKDDSFITIGVLTALVCLGVTIALGLIYYKTLSVKIAYLLSSESINLNFYFAIGVVTFITLLFFWVTPNYASVVMTGRVRATILVFLLLGPAAFLLIYHTMWRIAVNLTENSRLRESNELMMMEQKRYEELRAYMDETRNLRHDFRQHLLVMDEYARKGQTEMLSDYIGQFTESLKEHRAQIAANPALDAVAAHYESVAEMQSTHIKWLIELPSELPVKESDFITIFGNLVENALFAVSGIPETERTVHVNVRMVSDAMLGLTVKNPYKGTVKFGRDGLPKASRAGHGVGLQSVKFVVDRYGGAMDIDAENGLFSVGILLYV